jgi:hypothetical protein
MEEQPREKKKRTEFKKHPQELKGFRTSSSLGFS